MNAVLVLFLLFLPVVGVVVVVFNVVLCSSYRCYPPTCRDTKSLAPRRTHKTRFLCTPTETNTRTHTHMHTYMQVAVVQANTSNQPICFLFFFVFFAYLIFWFIYFFHFYFCAALKIFSSRSSTIHYSCFYCCYYTYYVHFNSLP